MDDLFLLEDEFTQEEKLIRDSVRDFVEATVFPVIGDAYLKGDFPTSFLKGVADLGLLGMTLPEQYGGSAASYVSYGLVCQELERGDSGLRSFVSVQSSLVMFPIFKYGSEDQKNRFLKKLATAEAVGCFGLTEPDSGSDPGSMKTRAEKTQGGYLLNGTKMWITNAPIADIAIVWAKLGDDIAGFIVEKNRPGFSTKSTDRKLSLRASHTGELIFQDVMVPEANRLPYAKGLAAPLSCLTQARYGIAWGVMGAAQHCFETALDYTTSRQQFQKPLAQFQLIQKDLVEMFNEITKAKILNLRRQRSFCDGVLGQNECL